MTILELWIPIVTATIIMWIASAVIWTVMPWHKKDYRSVSDEERVREALRGLESGLYNVPHCLSQAEFKEPAMQQKFVDGPIAFITMLPSGMPAMGKNMLQMIGYFLFVALLCAYFISRTLGPDAAYMDIFGVAASIVWIANAMGTIPDAIWFGRPWSSVAKSMFDALIYGLLAGGVFGWLAV